MCMAVNSHDLPVYKKNRFFSLPCIFKTTILRPISSTSLRRVFVLKTSYEVRTLKIGFHQTIELCELLTFCRIFKTNI